jgi:hypothetical protein
VIDHAVGEGFTHFPPQCIGDLAVPGRDANSLVEDLCTADEARYGVHVQGVAEDHVRNPAASDAFLGVEVGAHQGISRSLDVSQRPAGEPEQFDACPPGRVDHVLVLLDPVLVVGAGDEQDPVDAFHGLRHGIGVVVVRDPQRNAACLKGGGFARIADECGHRGGIGALQ